MFNRNEKSHFSWICCLIRCHSRLKSSLKQVYYPFNVSPSKLGLLLEGSDGNSPLHFVIPLPFFDWQECFIVCVLYAKLPVWYVTLATGEFLDVKNSTKKTQQHGQVGSQCLHSRLRTFRWAPLERFNGEKKHGEWGNFTSPKRLRTWEVVTVRCLSGKFSLEMCFGGLGWMNWLGWMSWLGGMRTADFFIVLRNLITFPMFFFDICCWEFFHICWYFLNREFFHNFAQLKNRPTAHTKHYGTMLQPNPGFD